MPYCSCSESRSFTYLTGNRLWLSLPVKACLSMEFPFYLRQSIWCLLLTIGVQKDSQSPGNRLTEKLYCKCSMYLSSACSLWKTGTLDRNHRRGMHGDCYCSPYAEKSVQISDMQCSHSRKLTRQKNKVYKPVSSLRPPFFEGLDKFA